MKAGEESAVFWKKRKKRHPVSREAEREIEMKKPAIRYLNSRDLSCEARSMQMDAHRAHEIIKQLF